MAIQITSDAFTPDGPIPKRHSGEGKDLSPPLRWSGLPEGTKQLVLIADDPDAPTPQPWVHWLLYNLPPETDHLPEGVKPKHSPSGAAQGVNSGGDIGYMGPMPPPGHGTHHYHFKIYALDEELNLEPGLDKNTLLGRMEGHVLDQGELVGTYERR